ncbi:ATP-binding protein [Sinosporangium siamense]|uniref:ATPase AAA n=1 Tax=Sinosporangium siamense TaxID=1367973 RepID=A0A919RE60_9ACTN|nr:ATP-binding protein [Sinosporangium siamense]GII90764.1 ATPase AAA [Sinosporangium siamense]
MRKNETVRAALALAIRANLPVLLWGAPGTGKTSTVVALARQLEMPVEVVVGSIREPSDFSGLPVVRDEGTWFAPPRWAERLASAESGLLFLDELTTASPAVQAAMLRVVLERAVGDLVLPGRVRIVAAANPPGLAADGWELSAPLANRLVHLDWQVAADDVAKGFVHGFGAPGAALVAAPTRTRIAAAKAQIGAFLRVRPELVLVVPDTPERSGRSWPSPRTWEMAAIAIAAGAANGSDEAVVAALVIGAVGEAAGFEALSWLRNLDLPAPETLLNDPAAPLPDRADRLHALLGSLVAHVVADGSTSSWERAWSVIARVAAATPDVAAASAQTLAANRPAGASLPVSMLALAPVLRSAGLMP